MRTPHRSTCWSPAPFSPHSLTRPRGTWTVPLGAGSSSWPGEGTPPFYSREPRPEIWRCCFSSWPLHTRLQTNPARAGGHGLMKPTGPHHLQRAKTQSWGHQTVITMAASRNSVHKSSEQNWWQGAALAEWKPHQKRVWRWTRHWLQLYRERRARIRGLNTQHSGFLEGHNGMPYPGPFPRFKLTPAISSWNFSTSHTRSGSFPIREVTFRLPRASFCS